MYKRFRRVGAGVAVTFKSVFNDNYGVESSFSAKFWVESRLHTGAYASHSSSLSII